MSFAIVNISGSQLKLELNKIYSINRVNSKNIGDIISLNQGCMLFTEEKGIEFNPSLSVKLEVLKHFRGKKIQILKFRRRKHHMKAMGHRSDLTLVKVNRIV